MLLLYFVLLHVLVLVLFWKSNFLAAVASKLGYQSSNRLRSHYRDMVAFHRRSVGTVPDEAVILIGDSLTQGLCAASVADRAVNYGIGADTTSGVLHRLPVYQPALQRASSIVLAIGVNDTKRRGSSQRRDVAVLANYRSILALLPREVPVIVSSVLPVKNQARNARIRHLNERLATLAAEFDNATFVDNTVALTDPATGCLRADCEVGDGIHLNSIGNSLWAEQLRSQLASLKLSNK